MTPTKIWTSWNGAKTPVPLMDKKHLKAAYVIIREIVVANERRKYWSERDEYDYKYRFIQANNPISFEQAKAWQIIFEEEALKRGIKLPVVTYETYEKSSKNRRERKQYCKDSFGKIIQ